MNLRTYLMIKAASEETAGTEKAPNWFKRVGGKLKDFGGKHRGALSLGGGGILGGLAGDALIDDDYGIGATAGTLGGGALAYYLTKLQDLTKMDQSTLQNLWKDNKIPESASRANLWARKLLRALKAK